MKKKGQLTFMRGIILGIIILGAATVFIYSDIGKPLYDALEALTLPKLSPICDTNSVRSIEALAYALDCTAAYHAGGTNICPAQKTFGNKVAACYGTGEDYYCEVLDFELTSNPGYEGPFSWITGMGDPNCLLYYEAFPQDQTRDWKVRVEDISMIGVFIGGACNVVPVVGKKIASVGKGALSRMMKYVATKSGRLAKFATKSRKFYRDIIGKTVLYGVKHEKEGIKVMNNVFKATDGFVVTKMEAGLVANGVAVGEVSEAVTKTTFKTMYTTGKSTTYNSMHHALYNTKTPNGLLGNILNVKQLDDIATHQHGLIKFATGKKGINKALSVRKKLRMWNAYSDILENGGKQFTPGEINLIVKKGSETLKHIPASQREGILQGSKDMAGMFVNSRTANTPVFQLGVLDIFNDAIPYDYQDEVGGFGTCAIMLRGHKLSTFGCAVVTSIGLLAAYADNDNEKYEPVGINSLGYKGNYYGVGTVDLEDITNYYYVALNRDTAQNPKRFFLASPCTTEKVVVKHEKIGCYFTECWNDRVCCAKKTWNSSSEEYVISHYEWTSESDCVEYAEDIVKTAIYDTGQSIKQGVLFYTGIGQAVVFYNTATTGNPSTEVTLPGGVTIDVLGNFQFPEDEGSYSDKENDQVCIDIIGDMSMVDRCRGAYMAYRFTGSDIPRYFYTNNPYVQTIAQYEGLQTNYIPEGKTSLEWTNTVEVEGAAGCYRFDPPQRELNAGEFQVQAVQAQQYNLDLDTTGTSNVIVPRLFMDSSGDGIKQCLQLTERFEIYWNPWSLKTKDNIDALTVTVELDETKSPNYCYSGVDWVGGGVKLGAMLVLAVIDGVVTVGTGGTATVAILFASGALYEGIAHHVDKASAWPHR